MNSNTRILFVYQFLGLGGVEVVLQSRLLALGQRGIDARALFLSGGAGDSLVASLRERVTVSADESEWAALLESFGPEWLLSIDTPQILPLARKHSPASRLIYEVHTPYPASQGPLLEAESLQGVQGLLVPSPSQRDLVRDLTADRWPVMVVPNALPPTFRPSASTAFPIPALPVIGWVGRLDPVKNWRGFVHAAAEMRDLDVQFWMAGGEHSSAVEREEFRRLAAELRLESRLTWFPSIAYQEMGSFYQAVGGSGGCLMSTSWAESFGMTILEAAACGCPVIVPDVIGLRDLVQHRSTGLVYPAVNASAAADAARTMLSSPSLRSTLTAGAARQLTEFSTDVATEALLEALDSIAGEGGGIPRLRRSGAGTVVAASQEQLIRTAASAMAEIEHRDRQIRTLQSELSDKVAERDGLIALLQEELRREVSLRDATIVGLQKEMQEKVTARDESMRALQEGLNHEISVRDEAKVALQDEMRDKVAARDETVRALQEELHQKVGAANQVISGLQAELSTAQLQATRNAAERELILLEAERRHGQEILARDERLLNLRSEMQQTVADLQSRLRELEASGREQQALVEMRLREAQIDHQRALLESARQLAAAAAAHEAEAALLRGEVMGLREELERRPTVRELESREVRIAQLEEARQADQEELLAARERASDLEAREKESSATARAERELNAVLAREHQQLHLQVAELRNELVAASAALHDQEALTDEIRETLRSEATSMRLRLSNTQFELGMTRQELLAIYRSKLWKLGSAYWRWLQGIGRLPRTAGSSTQDGWQHLPVACPSCGDTIRLLDLLMAAPPTAAEEIPAAQETSTAGEGNVVALFPEAPLAPLASENKHDVVCFPIIDWDFRFQRPQQLMLRYARAGHRVFYISQRFRPSGRSFEIRRVTESIYEVSLKAPKKNIYSSTMSRKELDEFFASLDALRKDAAIHAAAAVVQHPFWWSLAQRARAEFAWPLIYDCMDHHHGFSGTTKEAVHEERKLMRSADLVVVSSAFLERQARKHTEKVLLVRNGCDYDHFAGIARKPRMARPVIGYYGAIADWFDSDLVADLATRRPDWDFVLVGSSHLADLRRLETLPNVRLVGEKAYSEVPEWLASFDVAIIPFKRTPLTEATNPVKCYEMLAGGKPIVAVPIPEVAQLAPFIHLASTSAEFEREIIAALAMDSEERSDERQRFARANTWDSRFAVLEPAVEECFPLASVVIVTYNNLELNRECLRTLYARTEWPRLEVFVVDNASTDGTPEFLREAEQMYPGLKVLLNSRNAGFPAANNQALKEVSGQYVALLNNDTVLVRGWLSSLIRHLHRDPKIGLIGPSTNAIGNEGMVEVGYREVEDMPAWAAHFVRQQDGEIFDIPMLAMFCVATRRSTLDKVGLLDENFGMGMFEDDDYSHRVRQLKLRVVCARDSFVHHWMRAAFSKVPQAEYEAVFAQNRKYFEKKWDRPWEPHQRAKN